jgi:beta-glucosidase
VSFTVKNVGGQRGSEIAQVYIQDVESSVSRPVKELKGFQKVDLNPGLSTTITLRLGIRDFSFWNPQTRDWFVESGKFIIHVGSSSRDIKLRKEVDFL